MTVPYIPRTGADEPTRTADADAPPPSTTATPTTTVAPPPPSTAARLKATAKFAGGVTALGLGVIFLAWAIAGD